MLLFPNHVSHTACKYRKISNTCTTYLGVVIQYISLKTFHNRKSLSPDFSLGILIASQQSPQGSFHIPVPQSIYERVESGSYNSVKESKELALAMTIGFLWLNVYDWAGPKVEGHHYQMGTTGPNSFVPCLGWLQFHHCLHNESIRDQYQCHRKKEEH